MIVVLDFIVSPAVLLDSSLLDAAKMEVFG